MGLVQIAKPNTPASELALEIYASVLEAVGPERIMGRACALRGPALELYRYVPDEDLEFVDAEPLDFDLSRYGSVFLCGAGKASCGLAAPLLKLLGDRIAGGLIVTKYGHGLDLGPVKVVEAAHPIPNQSSQAAGESMVSFADSCGDHDLVLFLLSGGASALMEVPEPGIDLPGIGGVTATMMANGANIYDLNAVRSRLSAIKGGKLGARFRTRNLLCLVLSDVIGNDYRIIGSGPLTPADYDVDLTELAQRYGALPLIPEDARDLLRPQPEKELESARHVLIGSPEMVPAAIEQACRNVGITALRLPGITHEASEEGAEFALRARQGLADGKTERCVYATGEPVVTVRGSGKGGRCQEFACAAADILVGRDDLAVLAGSTDGSDGPTDAAGGVVDGGSVARAAANGWTVERALENNNSFSFLRACDGLIFTGPTQSNVNDLFLAVKG